MSTNVSKAELVAFLPILNYERENGLLNITGAGVNKLTLNQIGGRLHLNVIVALSNVAIGKHHLNILLRTERSHPQSIPLIFEADQFVPLQVDTFSVEFSLLHVGWYTLQLQYQEKILSSVPILVEVKQLVS